MVSLSMIYSSPIQSDPNFWVRFWCCHSDLGNLTSYGTTSICGGIFYQVVIFEHLEQITESKLIAAPGKSIRANLDQICFTNWCQFFATICLRGIRNRISMTSQRENVNIWRARINVSSKGHQNWLPLFATVHMWRLAMVKLNWWQASLRRNW